MVSESSRQLNIFTPHVTANVSVAPFVSTTRCAVPKRFHMHAQNFQSVACCNIFQNKVTTLNNRKFAVFDDALDTLVRLRFCFAFDA